MSDSSWRTFWRDPAGKRFRNRFERTQDYGPVRKALVLGGGGVLVVVGIIFMPLPGPGILIVLFGAAMMAGQSLTVARALDAVETKVRGWFGR